MGFLSVKSITVKYLYLNQYFGSVTLFLSFNLFRNTLMFQYYKFIFHFRTTASTYMHDHSSRSHAIVTINFIQVRLISYYTVCLSWSMNVDNLTKFNSNMLNLWCFRKNIFNPCHK